MYKVQILAELTCFIALSSAEYWKILYKVNTVSPSKEYHALVVIAHPDDEAIFFFGIIRHLLEQRYSITILCATGRFDDAEITITRTREFMKSCQKLGVEGHMLGIQDRRGRGLCVSELREQLWTYGSDPTIMAVYTHNPWGDYGHPHHVSVSLATHEVFGNKVLSLSGPLMSKERIRLSDKEYKIKLDHMRDVYRSQEFAWTWCSKVEAFSRLGLDNTKFLSQFAQHYRPGNEFRFFFEGSEARSQERLQLISSIIFGFSQRSSDLPAELENIPYKVWSQPLRQFWEQLKRIVGNTDLLFANPITE